MAKAKFDLGNTLADVLGNVSEPDRAPEQIVLLPLDSIDGDEKNFYSMEGIEALAANIERVGLLDPIRVRENPDMPGRYLIVSGHRRRAALWTLFEEEPDKWGKVPCIIEPPAESPEMQELRLIYANADTRILSDADQSAQAERVEMLLYKLSEQGVNFPGRMRAHVAAACKTSSTKIAEWKAIREKLVPELRQMWESGKLNHSVAYRLAQAEEHAQTRLTELYTAPQIAAMAEWQIADRINALHALSLFCCPDGSGQCNNIPAREERDLVRNGNCHARCCIGCYWLSTCDNCCNKAEAKKQQLIEENKARDEELAAIRKRAAEEDAAQQQTIITEGLEEWKRVGLAAKAAGVTARALAAFLDCDDPEDVEDETVAEVDQRMKGTFRLPRGVKPWNTKSYNNPMDACDEPQVLVDLADLLKCSTDYLLGRTEFLSPPADDRGLISVDEHYPKEGQYVMAFTRNLVPLPSVYFRAAFMDCTEKSVGNVRLNGIEYWAPLPQLPAGKKWPGQETVEGLVKK